MHKEVILLAFSAFWLTEALRVVPWLERWRDRKPLACSLCMSLWTGLACVVAALGLGVDLDWLDVGGALGGAYTLLRLLEKPKLLLK